MRNHLGVRLRRVGDKTRLAERAWQRFTYGRPYAPAQWFDLVEQFAEETKPASVERTVAVVLLGLDNCRDWEALVDGGWIFLIPVHVSLHFDWRGVGDVRALRIADRFLEWLGHRSQLHEWDLACLRSRSDRQRTNLGGKSRGVPEAYDVGERGWEDREDLIERFLREVDLGVAPAVAENMIQMLAHATRLRGTNVVRFGALNPRALWSLTHRGDLGVVPPRDAGSFLRELTSVGARFFAWLADGAHLEPGRARQLERELVAAAPW